MRLISNCVLLPALGVAAALVVGSAALHAGQAAQQPRRQQPAPQTPAVPSTSPAAAPRAPMAEEVFTNVQVMKGVPADQFLASMGFISNALAVNCTYCHLGEGGGGWAEYAKDNDKKRMARRMITMMNGINQTYFGGRRTVTCVSCHNGSNRPKASPNLAAYYNVPVTDEPEDITRQATGAPTADQVLEKFMQAVGGAQKLNAIKSYVAKGKDLGYGDAEPVPLQIFAKAPNQLSEVVTTGNGPRIVTFDGRTGWAAVPDAYTPLPKRALTGAELEGARLDAMLAFPAQIKQALMNWRGAVPTAIGDVDVQVIQGSMANGFPVKLYFEEETGLLVRQIRYIDTALGRATWQIDYSDYRDAGGVKMPFKRTLLWQSGKSEVEIDDIQPNAALDASRFARP
jgi:hypothetical protein